MLGQFKNVRQLQVIVKLLPLGSIFLVTLTAAKAGALSVSPTKEAPDPLKRRRGGEERRAPGTVSGGHTNQLEVVSASRSPKEAWVAAEILQRGRRGLCLLF